MSSRRVLVIGLSCATASLFGCPQEPAPRGVLEGVYVVVDDPTTLQGETFFDHPFPSDLRMIGGRVSFAGWPNPRNVPLLDEYIGFLDGRLDGFSPIAA